MSGGPPRQFVLGQHRLQSSALQVMLRIGLVKNGLIIVSSELRPHCPSLEDNESPKCSEATEKSVWRNQTVCKAGCKCLATHAKDFAYAWSRLKLLMSVTLTDKSTLIDLTRPSIRISLQSADQKSQKKCWPVYRLNESPNMPGKN